MDSVFQDLRFGLRQLRTEPGFTAAALLTLAIGLGMSSAVAGLADAMLLRRPELPRSDELFRLYGESADSGHFDVLSYPNYADLRDGLARVAALAVHQHTPVNVGAPEAGESVTIELVSGNYFAVLGVVPAMGRLLRADDDLLPAGRSVVVVSDHLWRGRLGSDPAAVGRSLLLNGHPFEIVGVAPPGFRGSFEALAAEAWVPVTTQDRTRPRGLELNRRGWGWLFATGRRRPEATTAALEAGLSRIVAEMRGDGRLDASESFHTAAASPLPDSTRADALRATPLVVGVVVALLVAVCANLGGLLFARGVAREREIATRQAIGAGPRRLLRQLLVETLLLSALGAALGLLLARWSASLLAWLIPPELQGLSPEPRLDGRVLAVAAGAAVLTALASGLAPALRAAHAAPVMSLRSGTRAVGGRGGELAVALQAAVSVALLVVSALLLHSLRRSQAYHPGFDVERLALVSFDLRRHGYDEARGRVFHAALEERLRRLPGVENVAMATMVPLGDTEDVQSFEVPGHTPPPGKEGFTVDVNVVDADYFKTLGIRLRRGRSFEPEDMSREARTVVVSDAFARCFWPGGEAVGHTIQERDGRELAIVGVAADVPYSQLGEMPRPIVYASLGVDYKAWVTLHVRTRKAPAAVLPAVRRVFAELDPRVAPHAIRTFVEQRASALLPARALGLVTGSFGLVALGLAAGGLYGLLSYAVRQRRREIGIRIALGAAAPALVKLVLGRALRPAAAGAFVGSAVAVGVGRAIGHFLFGVGALDAVSHVAALGLIGVAACFAAAAPTLQALRVDPAAALRAE